MHHCSGPWDAPQRRSSEFSPRRISPRPPCPRRQNAGVFSYEKDPRPVLRPVQEVLPLAILGGGAAGLFAGCRAGELGLSALVLERKNKPGRKLMMSGNGRCNLTKDLFVSRLLTDMGGEMETFLAPALNALPPRAVMTWFERHGVPLKRMEDKRIFPASEKAADVVHALVDGLRDVGTSLCLNAPVLGVRKVDGQFVIQTQNFSLRARNILIATGGVSYPKTGSVGDGQQWAKALGHTLAPYRPGLIGFVFDHPWTRANSGRTLEQVVFRVLVRGRTVYEGGGQMDCETWGVGGAAAYNASRLVGRDNLTAYEIEWTADGKTFRVENPGTRPLKEAIVTIGGVPLCEIDPKTMQSTRCPGLFFAGEVMDVDGPTGGYNITAAFATAALAVAGMKKTV